MKCSLAGCERDARWQIGMKMWPPGVVKTKDAPHVEFFLGLACCDRCRHQKVKIEDFLSDEGRAQIIAAFYGIGKLPPDFATAELKFDKIENDKLKGMPDEQAGNSRQ